MIGTTVVSTRRVQAKTERRSPEDVCFSLRFYTSYSIAKLTILPIFAHVSMSLICYSPDITPVPDDGILV